MSGSLDPYVPEIDSAIDCLVANELDADARRRLLLQLERSPDGWRRCALAFLEDQAWRSALAKPNEGAVPRAPASEPRAQARSKLTPARIGSYVLVATLGGLIATLGVRWLRPSVERPTSLDVATTLQSGSPAVEVAVEPGQPIGWISLIDPSAGESMPQRVPVLAATAANQRWLQEQPATMPEYVRAQWERRGYEVEENHRLVGLSLDDGRQVAIPVDEVGLNYVGRQPL